VKSLYFQSSPLPEFSGEFHWGPVDLRAALGRGVPVRREALNDDPLARELFGVGKFADQSQVGEWLREQTQDNVRALRRLGA
jgi:hypothetical protein